MTKRQWKKGFGIGATIGVLYFLGFGLVGLLTGGLFKK